MAMRNNEESLLEQKLKADGGWKLPSQLFGDVGADIHDFYTQKRKPQLLSRGSFLVQEGVFPSARKGSAFLVS